MTLFDDPFRALADTLVNNVFGREGTLKVTTPGTYNPETDTESAASVAEHELKVSPPSMFEQKEIDGTDIQKGDFTVTLAAKTAPVIPSQQNQALILDNIEYQIMRVDPLYSGDLVATYTLHCRR